jgi:hypothetical protein
LRAYLAAVFVAVVLFPAAVFAQAPELSLREFASGQIKKGVRWATCSARPAIPSWQR